MDSSLMSSANIPIQSIPEKNELLKCKSCSFSTKGKGKLRLHSLIHQQKLFSCKKCSFVTQFEKLLILHSKNHTELKKEFQCPDCPFVTSRNGYLQRHLFVHNKVTPLKCPSCNFLSFSLENFEAHKAKHESTQLHTDFPNNINSQKSSVEEQEMKNAEFQNHLLVKRENVDHKISIEYKILGKPKAACDKYSQEGQAIHQNNKNEDYKNKLNSGIYESRRSYNTWTLEDKKEIYWCYVYARHRIFGSVRYSYAKKMKDKLIERGIMDPTKVLRISNYNLYGLIRYILSKGTVSQAEMAMIQAEVEECIKCTVFNMREECLAARENLLKNEALGKLNDGEVENLLKNEALGKLNDGEVENQLHDPNILAENLNKKEHYWKNGKNHYNKGK